MHISDNFADLNYWSLAVMDNILHPLLMLILCLLSVFVVLGNLLVVTAIWHETQLHSVTNYLIASLAAADCLVGAVVMPFSIISETIIGSWTFGATWCDMWHSFDVLASTASIMNLCSISLDRYLAITNPISYPRKMTPKRVALLIVSLWAMSSLISFPAILWWRAVGPKSLQLLTPPTTTISPLDLTPMTFTPGLENDSSLYKCVFTDDTYYLLFSSIVSFYGPLCIMLYAYYRIYKAAVQQTRFLKHGSKQVMIGRSKKSRRSRNVSEHTMTAQDKYDMVDGIGDNLTSMEQYDRQHLVLRAHRGGGGTNQNKMVNGDSSAASRADQKKREINNCDSTPSKRDPDKSANQINSNKQPSGIKNQYSDVRSNTKDKLRVERQRFDPESQEKCLSYVNMTKDHQLDNCRKQGQAPRLIDNPVKAQKENESKPEQYTKNMELLARSSPRDKPPVGKPLLASVGNRSTSVDVTIIDRPTTHEFRGQLYDCGAQQTNRDSNHVVRDRSKGEIYGRSPSDVDDGISDDMYECESFSASIDSYGTGSIASVLVKPQPDDRNFEERSNVEKNCDINHSPYTSSHRLRRALSFEDHSQNERNRWKSFDASMKDQTTVMPDAKNRENTIQAQFGQNGGSPSYRKGSDIVVSFKTVKSLDIRSWVKLAKTQRQCKPNFSGDAESLYMRPPPSLVPLMMMNSDTSTDSSIVTTADGSTRKLGWKHEAKKGSRANSVSVGLLSSMGKNEQTSINQQDVKAADSKSTDSLTESTQCNHQNNNRVLRIDQDKGDKGSKCQMVYYDSDKLIRSIVDLTAIRYIDCTNQADREEGISTKIEPITDSTDKLQSETVDQTTIAEHERTNLPRQNRTVGKKLSKLAKERKAAKTLGIVVGVFILCWLPFFVVNIIVALCGIECIYKPQILISIVTWLGWLNSAMNPVIYACWSRDFRRAFRRVLCAWVEFICPYDGAKLAKIFGLKKTSSYAVPESHLTRTYSSMKANTSSTIRSGLSVEGRNYGLDIV